jgi:catechol 2,3-dioxygenase-like lactoylglutathione lyase family enzyme
MTTMHLQSIDLSVDDADRSVVFYEALLGARAERRTAEQAVFALHSPPFVLTLDERRAPGGAPPAAGRHDGFDLIVTKLEQVGTAVRALRRAGVRLRLEDEGIEALDPDGNAWRVRFMPSAKDLAVVARPQQARR